MLCYMMMNFRLQRQNNQTLSALITLCLAINGTRVEVRCIFKIKSRRMLMKYLRSSKMVQSFNFVVWRIWFLLLMICWESLPRRRFLIMLFSQKHWRKTSGGMSKFTKTRDWGLLLRKYCCYDAKCFWFFYQRIKYLF